MNSGWPRSCLVLLFFWLTLECTSSLVHSTSSDQPIVDDQFDIHLEFDGPVAHPGVHVYGLDRPDLDLRPIMSRETATNEFVIQLKEGVEPQALAQDLGLTFVKCLTFSDSLCIFAQDPAKREARSILSIRDHPSIEWMEEQVKRHYAKFQTPSATQNPLWTVSFHLNNTFSGYESEDVNILPAWAAGWSGKGVRIGIVDDSVEWQHPDLIQFYVPETSWDFNDNDPDPSPKKSSDVHGTSVAGVALGSNNNVCSLGAGFQSELSGFRLISDGVTDAMIGQCLTYSKEIEIYSNSWGSASAFGGSLSSTLKAALTQGVTQGRGGKGFIYTFAAGNSREENNNANYDSLTNAPETIAVAAVSWKGVFSSYSNPGSALFISAPSNGDGKGISTTDRTGSLGYATGSCTGDFGGTSSACPLVSGVIALILEANPNLGWRDVQWVLAKSARKNDPSNSDWRRNAAGFWVNHNYGFGVIDATKAIEVAKTWKNVPKRESVTRTAVIRNGLIPNNSTGFVYSFQVDQDLVVEHVQLSISLSHRQIRGVAIDLYSPSGTSSRLLATNAPTYLTQLTWTFTTNFNWGEGSRGQWTLRVLDYNTADSITGQVSASVLTVWGYQGASKLSVNSENYCPNSQVIFTWTNNTIQYLTLTSTSQNPSTRTVSVLGKTSQTETLAAGSWTASISFDPSSPVDSTSFTLKSCTATFISVQVLDCGKIDVVYNLAPAGSSIVMKEVSDGTQMTVPQSISGTGILNVVRPYYGNWVASILQSGKNLTTSNQFSGQLCTAPTLTVSADQQCSSSKVIRITAQNTQQGMVLSAQAVGARSQVFSVNDNTSTNEALVLEFQRPTPDGTWSARLTFGTQTFDQETFEVSTCLSPEISVNAENSCTQGVTVSWKNAPIGSYIAIVPASSTLIYSYAPTNGKTGSMTLDLDNGNYEAVLTTAAFQAIVFTPQFSVNCGDDDGDYFVIELRISSVTNTSAVLSWTDMRSYGILGTNIGLSKDGSNWRTATVAYESSVNLVQLSPNTLYYTRVQGADWRGNPLTEWSQVITFSTMP